MSQINLVPMVLNKTMEAATYLNELFGMKDGEMNAENQVEWTWVTPWKFIIILTTQRNQINGPGNFDESLWQFKYHDLLQRWEKNKYINADGLVDPSWIPYIINQLEKDSKKLETGEVGCRQPENKN